VLSASIRHVVRASPLRALGAAAILTATPVVIAVLLHEQVHGALLASTVIAAASLAYAAEDDAAVLLASSPTTLVHRRLVRLGVALGIVLVGWTLAASLALGRTPVVTRQLGALGVTTAGASLAIGTSATRRDLAQPGFGGAIGGLTVVLLVAGGALSVRWLPAIDDPSAWLRWLALGAAGWGIAAWETRDPAARPARRLPR